MFKGIAASDGIGIGCAALIRKQSISYEKSSKLSVSEETARFDRALNEYIEKTAAMAEHMKKSVGEKEAEILSGHVLMLSDPSMTDEVIGKIAEGATSEYAAEQVLDMFAAVFEGTGDELTQQRAADLRDIKNGLISVLCGAGEVSLAGLPAGSVIVAEELTPSMTAGIVKENIAGIVTEAGGRTSHSAILARALEIPAVLGVANVTSAVSDGERLIVDGTAGEVLAAPDKKTEAEYEDRMAEFKKSRAELLRLVGRPTETADGIRVDLFCNIGKPEECAAALEHDGEGIGLFRTEFLYMEASERPSEQEQFEAYKKAAAAMAGRPVIIRTLDVGGDKDIPYLGFEKEENPFLGFRAVRYCLKNQELFMDQLRALLRASAFGGIRIMLPLVTSVKELREARELLSRAMRELDERGEDYNRDIPLGVMIETPAAAMIADLLAAEADFFSIGTNDLTGYTMCVDRGNRNVAYLYSAYDPAVIRSIKRVIECGNARGIPVGMCGEAAADPCLAPLLIAFGLEEYSVGSASVLSVRNVISKWTKAEADEVAAKALACTTESDVRELLEKSRR